MRIGIIGAGVSAIAFAGVLKRFGHDCVLFEKAETLGGIWALAYPDVRLQNSFEQYRFIDFPWPHQPDRHPTATQILNYLDQAVQHHGLDVRFEHEVRNLIERSDGWTMEVEHRGQLSTHEFDRIIVGIGQYAEGKHRPEFAGEAEFSGQIVTERDVKDFSVFQNQRVAVVGFGKSAVDMAAFATPLASRVEHVFRTPRWLIPFTLLGLHYSYPFFCRASTLMMPSWVHAGGVERWLHERTAGVVRTFWRMIERLVRRHIRSHRIAADLQSEARLARVTPSHSFVGDLRSATAMAPVTYFQMVAEGRIEPTRGELERFDANGIVLNDDRRVHADVVVLALGSKTPQFPFLPAAYREIAESEYDGVQLYRHMLHPDIPNLAFAGYNHGFMHIAAAELGALWLAAVWRGDLELPSAAQQRECIDQIRSWKREHVQFEPSRSCAVSTRFQQYIDAILIELGQTPYRKLPNPFAEIFARYGGGDYSGIVERVRNEPPPEPRQCHPFIT